MLARSCRYTFPVILVGASLLAPGVAQASPFSRDARRDVDEVWRGLQSCGLRLLDAHDPSLPRPQTPADIAIVTSQGRLLAYYLETFGLGTTLKFKNPNGGMVHRVSFSRSDLKYLTPYAGTVAHGNRFMTVGGPRYHYYCRSRRVSAAQFKACTTRRFVDVVVRQLCRFATP